MTIKFPEKKALQAAVALACLVPLFAGGKGMLYGQAAFENGSLNLSLDSHVRYLSGLLFAIGLAFLTTIPQIEQHAVRFRLLTLIVFMGGIARLGGIVFKGIPDPGMLAGLCMELIITPLLCLWQSRIVFKTNL